MVRALIDNFLQYLRYERNRSELTVKAYSMDLEMFRNYIRLRTRDWNWKMSIPIL